MISYFDKKMAPAAPALPLFITLYGNDTVLLRSSTVLLLYGTGQGLIWVYQDLSVIVHRNSLSLSRERERDV